jgi:hypothetical protein
MNQYVDLVVGDFNRPKRTPGFLQEFPRGIELVGAQQHAGTVGERLGRLQPIARLQREFRAFLVALERVVVLALRHLEVREVVQVQRRYFRLFGSNGDRDAPGQVLARALRLFERNVGIAKARKRLRYAGLVVRVFRSGQQFVQSSDRALVVSGRLLCLGQAAQRLVPCCGVAGLGVHYARLLEVGNRVVELPAVQGARAFAGGRERGHEFLSRLARADRR